LYSGSEVSAAAEVGRHQLAYHCERWMGAAQPSVRPSDLRWPKIDAVYTANLLLDTASFKLSDDYR